MDDSWQAEWEEEKVNTPTAGLGYYGELCVEGVRISLNHCPDCLKYENFDCYLCSFFAPETCPLLCDPFLMQDVETVISIWREHQAAQTRRQEMLILAVRSELQAHGRPLHYTVLTRMVSDRHPELRVSERSVLLIMTHHPDIFERVAEGVYKCRRKR
ncbi:MAG: hypothetical protein H5T62_07370 [Anaerolineae bacterium]|nr:hypothetical protein [Anaerolineae bacterium]